MSFAPALPVGGYAGWRFLSRTLEAQQAAFARSQQIRRDAEHFRATIARVRTPEDLVGDRRLLRVALGAFGLDADLPNRFLIRKVLEGGTLDPRALANRLGDRRYAELARGFGFDLGVPNTGLSDFPDRILRAFETRQFEIAVGAVDENMRLALNLRRELAALGERDISDRAKWFTVLGTPPLRLAFETALGLPRGFGALDLDRQLEVVQRRSEASFGAATVAELARPDRLEALIRRFLLRAEAEGGGPGGTGAGRGAAALQLLQTAAMAPRPWR